MTDLTLIVLPVILFLLLTVFLVLVDLVELRFVIIYHVLVVGGVHLAEVCDLVLVLQLQLSQNLMVNLFSRGILGLKILELVYEHRNLGGRSLHFVLEHVLGLLLQLADLVLVVLVVLFQRQLCDCFQVVLALLLLLEIVKNGVILLLVEVLQVLVARVGLVLCGVDLVFVLLFDPHDKLVLVILQLLQLLLLLLVLM